MWTIGESKLARGGKKDDVDSRKRRWKRRNKKVDEILESGLGGTIFCCKPFLSRANRYRYIACYAFFLASSFLSLLLSYSLPALSLPPTPWPCYFHLLRSRRAPGNPLDSYRNERPLAKSKIRRGESAVGWMRNLRERCKCKTIKWRIDRKTERGWLLEIFFRARFFSVFSSSQSMTRSCSSPSSSSSTSNGHSIIDRWAVISSVCRDRSECLEYHSSVGRFPFDLQ